MNTKKGLTGLIILIIFAAIIAFILGFNIKEIFVDHILPIIKFGWGLLVAVIVFFNDVVVWIMGRVRDILGIV